MSDHLALIIEDDEDLSEIFGQALTAAGFTIEIIRDGLLAQERLKEIVPTVITLDMHIPHISGDILLTRMLPLSVNLTALFERLTMICCRRCGSPMRTGGKDGSISVMNSRPLSAVILSMTLRRLSSKSTGLQETICIFSLPASIWTSSNRSLTM